MSEIASEYGYETNPEDLEKIFVKTQTLNEKELAAVTSGNEEDDLDYGMPDNASRIITVHSSIIKILFTILKN